MCFITSAEEVVFSPLSCLMVGWFVSCITTTETTEPHLSPSSLLTRALLMYWSWQALPFSFLPPQAFRAEACRARPKEKVRAQGRCRGHWLMAFRLMVASSSL